MRALNLIGRAGVGAFRGFSLSPTNRFAGSCC